MIKIRLNRSAWKFDDSQPLGSAGGFGEVFRGEAMDGMQVAVKRLHVDANVAAHRELRVAEDLIEASHQHVIPILDSGQDADSDRYFIVMPIASHSLEDYVRSQGSLNAQETTEILLQIAKGLREAGKLVHRDLKPANVLAHNGNWKIADFGIARFVTDATSINTLKDCLTPEYAAPEQWKLERATPATDIYALGCIAYKCLSGKPPFKGDFTRLREQHQSATPPPLGGNDPKLRSLAAMMLRKHPASRPSLSRIISQLEAIKNAGGASTSGGAWSALENAGAAVAEAEAKAEVEREREVSARQLRHDLYKEAMSTLWALTDDLFSRIENHAPMSKREHQGILRMGRGSILIKELPQNPIAPGLFPHSRWDVVCGGAIKVAQDAPQYAWSSSLWYGKQHPSGEYRWWEVSFWDTGQRHTFEPFHLENLQDADLAMSNIIHTYMIAWGPRTIDDEDSEDFFSRWVKLFAESVQGRLGRPMRLPLQ